MSGDRATYLDSSALVKLIVAEPETVALRAYLRGRQRLVSSALARIEVAPGRGRGAGARCWPRRMSCSARWPC